MQTSHDVVIVGGSFAGLAAALQLGRARRKVLLVDAGQPRNRFAAHSHGLLGHDGKPPREILREAAAQIAAYSTVEIVDGYAERAQKEADGRFTVALSNDLRISASRLILATGVTDQLPPLPGLEARWGATVFACPYCHGYEFRDRQLGVLANHAISAHHGILVPDWGPTTYFTQGVFEPDEAQTAQMTARGARIERVPVVELLGAAPALEAVKLADGRVVPIDALLTAPRFHQSSPLAEQLGCEFEAGPLGALVKVDNFKHTTIEGVYVPGDASSPMASVTFASAAGAMAGFAVHQSLVMGYAH
ncbi:NAD(P)/FAD-dependent oxidoreductase [Paraburkholderia sp.]|uniref:NAD(P)/FAD-dependent oxidoreductase n=1 Tax=Paraburkholderia sp. TaxID=1926495 RepID=UPI003D6DD133